MGIFIQKRRPLALILLSVFCLIFASACQFPTSPSGSNSGTTQGGQSIPTPTSANIPASPTAGITPSPTATATPTPIALDIPGHAVTPTPSPSPTPAPPLIVDTGRPLLAFYYMWYDSNSWSASKLPDTPTIKYNSADVATIDRQVGWAANAGLTGFISSWWGPGDRTDHNFAQLLARSEALYKKTKQKFASTIYLETYSTGLDNTSKLVSGLRYLSKYTKSPYFFHWQGKPVIFIWSPLGNGRTLSQWASIRQQVDPNHQMIWSAEGVDMALLDVFDGIHLFSGGYWGLQHGTMTAVDQGFRAKVDAYNSANGTRKIWAAGVIPGYDDTKVAGRQGTYVIQRDNGATYTTSFTAAMASNPEWITITSFNEWFEGAMIEPSVTYGSKYLNMTQQFAQQWHGS